MRRSWVPVVLVLFGCGGQTEQGEGGTGGTVVFTGGSGGTGATGATGGAITGGIGGIGGIGGTGPGGAGGTAGGPCVQVGGKCDYFKPNCCGPLHCSLVGICSETSSCSGEGQPCGSGCCGGLACSPTGMCVVGPTPTCPPGTTTCTSCLSSQCCPQLSACQASPSCAKAYYCLAECEKTTDLPTCVSMCDTGAPELKTLAVCGFTNCSAACQ